MEFLKLFLAIRKVVHFLRFLLVDDVFLACGRDIQQHHTPLDACSEVDVRVQVLRRPEIHELYHGIPRAYAVDASETLDDTHRIPVYIVVDKIVAILQILPF